MPRIVRRFTPWTAGPYRVAELRRGGYAVIDTRTGRAAWTHGRRPARIPELVAAVRIAHRLDRDC